jgi:hypothetical protein
MSKDIRKTLMLALAGHWLKTQSWSTSITGLTVTPQQVLDAARIVHKYDTANYKCEDGHNPTLKKELSKQFGSDVILTASGNVPSWPSDFLNWSYVGNDFIRWLHNS